MPTSGESLCLCRAARRGSRPVHSQHEFITIKPDFRGLSRASLVTAAECLQQSPNLVEFGSVGGRHVLERDEVDNRYPIPLTRSPILQAINRPQQTCLYWWSMRLAVLCPRKDGRHNASRTCSVSTSEAATKLILQPWALLPLKIRTISCFYLSVPVIDWLIDLLIHLFVFLLSGVQ